MVAVNNDIALMAHLMRRAGFGATKDKLVGLMDNGYEHVVDELIEPTEEASINDPLLRRYFPDQGTNHDSTGFGAYTLFRLVTTKQPLKEKMAFFWNNIFATGYAKVTTGKVLGDQLRMFRKHGMGTLDNLLLELSRDPAMIIWLDNIDNHKGAINENYGRELLELFSMGVGNYSEEDIKECSRAFTGWTVDNAIYTQELAIRNSIYPYGKIAWRYNYDEVDHDDGEKTFLGETGRFNGEDIVEIICRQPATARFIARHLYHFFVADEPPVTQWPYKEPQDQEAIDILVKAYFDTGHDIGEMVRVLLNSDFFKSEECRYKRIKSPVDLAVSILRITGEFDWPTTEIANRYSQVGYMGQALAYPPSVEGWHQGLEWIETGSITERVNFASQQLGDLNRSGIKQIVDNVLGDYSMEIDAEMLVNRCLAQLGVVEVSEKSRETLTPFVEDLGFTGINDQSSRDDLEKKIPKILSVIGAVPEYLRA